MNWLKKKSPQSIADSGGCRSAFRSDAIDIVCNSDLDPREIEASRLARETAMKEKWNEGFDDIDTLMNRKRY